MGITGIILSLSSSSVWDNGHEWPPVYHFVRHGTVKVGSRVQNAPTPRQNPKASWDEWEPAHMFCFPHVNPEIRAQAGRGRCHYSWRLEWLTHRMTIDSTRSAWSWTEQQLLRSYWTSVTKANSGPWRSPDRFTDHLFARLLVSKLSPLFSSLWHSRETKSRQFSYGKPQSLWQKLHETQLHLPGAVTHAF